MTRTFMEFFAGGGMARAGLGDGWRCVFANDVDRTKCAAYRANWGGAHLVEADIRALGVNDLPAGRADLAWASFPCQDLSLAGRRAGLAAGRSGLFFEYARLIGCLRALGRAPRLLVIENVAGLLTSHCGEDFRAVAKTIASLGYAPGAMVIDARRFLPQSRPRLFVFGLEAESGGAPPQAADETTPASLLAAVAGLDGAAARRWSWIGARPPGGPVASLESLIDCDAAEWSAAEARRILAGMTELQRAAVNARRRAGGVHVGTVYRRMRVEDDERRARYEARFDGLAGCLRTPAGGSSVQRLLRLTDGAPAARQMTPREAARLMGLADDYVLPASKTQALKLCGDGVAVPVARWIADAILEPALAARRKAA